MLLEQIYYTVNSLEGDYAYLKKEEDASEDLKCVARACCRRRLQRGQDLCTK